MKKELSLIKREVEKISVKADIKIKSQKDLDSALVIRKNIKEIQKSVKDKKEEITKPINEALKNVRELFKPIEAKLDLAEKSVSFAMIDWEQRKRKEIEKKLQEVEGKIARGDISFSKASEIIERAEEKVAVIPIRKIKKVRITDKSKLSLDYLIPDLILIKKELMDGKVVDGAELYEEEIIFNK